MDCSPKLIHLKRKILSTSGLVLNLWQCKFEAGKTVELTWGWFVTKKLFPCSKTILKFNLAMVNYEGKLYLLTDQV